MPPSTEDLQAADDELWAALLHGDGDAVEAIADSEMSVDLGAVGIESIGGLIEELRTGQLRLEAAELERRRLRITGELATSVAIVSLRGTQAGSPLSVRLRWIWTWRLAATWELIAASCAPIRGTRRGTREGGPGS